MCTGLVARLEAQLDRFGSFCLEAQLGSFRDSNRLCSARHTMPGSARMRKLRWTWLGLVFVAACNQDKCATFSVSMVPWFSFLGFSSRYTLALLAGFVFHSFRLCIAC